MRWPRLRFTIRHSMIAIALAAFIFTGWQTARRWIDLQGQYLQYADFEKQSRENAIKPFVNDCSLVRYDEDTIRVLHANEVSYSLQLAEHCRQLKEKYALAMRQPWLPVEPDPPFPE